MRGHWLLLAFSTALGCGGSSLKEAGEPCSASTECAAGLVCDFGRDPHVCATMSTALPDAPVEPAVDAPPTPDAPPGAPDARPDAPLPDAPVDAMVDAPPPDA